MKFCFTIAKGSSTSDDLDTCLEGIDIKRLLSYLGTVRAGTKMHLVVRPRPGFNVEAMRNYFHGPVLAWIVQRLQDMGIPASREQMREELKRRFIGEDEDGKPLSIAKTLEVMTEGDIRDPERKYKEFLDDIKLWCIDTLGQEPPPPDRVDLCEDSDVRAAPETIK